MLHLKKIKKLSFLIYGLGLTGKSVVKFFDTNDIKEYQVWDEKDKNFLKNKRPINLQKTLKKVDYIILSPGVSLKKPKNKNLIKHKKKIITDLDLIFLSKPNFKSAVITGTNGKSTTCKILAHVLKENGYKVLLGGNIGTPILDLKIDKNIFLIIEASSFQLSHSKFISPDFAFILNITNDHLDWHGNMKDYINSKFKIFKLQKRNQYSILNSKLKFEFKKRKLKGKLIIPSNKNYKKIKPKVQNIYLRSNINDENMSNVFSFTKLIGLSEKSFLKSLKTFKGLPHRYELFLKKKNCVFINDSKGTSFHATKFALKNSKNTFWIVGGLPKKNDKINLKNLKKNIIKSYIFGKNIKFFKKQIQNQTSFKVSRTLRGSIIQVLKDIRLFRKTNNTILFSPASASFDQFTNFEKRGEKFKELTKYYARKFI